MREVVFVYGTLKRGELNHHRLSNAQYLGEATVEGYFRLLNLGEMPGLQFCLARSPVRGEIYRVASRTLRALDRLLGHPTFYYRDTAETPHGNAWFYRLSDQWTARMDLELPFDEIVDGRWPVREGLNSCWHEEELPSESTVEPNDGAPHFRLWDPQEGAG